MNKKENHSGISKKAYASHVARACSTIIPLCFFSLLLSLFLAFCANDMYAFVKPEGEVTIELAPTRSLRDTAKTLEERGIIENPALFCAYVKSKKADKKLTSVEGVIILDTSMSYREIVRVFAKNHPE